MMHVFFMKKVNFHENSESQDLKKKILTWSNTL